MLVIHDGGSRSRLENTSTHNPDLFVGRVGGEAVTRHLANVTAVYAFGSNPPYKPVADAAPIWDEAPGARQRTLHRTRYRSALGADPWPADAGHPHVRFDEFGGKRNAQHVTTPPLDSTPRCRCQVRWCFMDLRDDEIMQVICPTRQVNFVKSEGIATAGYFAWGCFRYFEFGPRRPCGLPAAPGASTCPGLPPAARTPMQAAPAGDRLATPAIPWCERRPRDGRESPVHRDDLTESWP